MMKRHHTRFTPLRLASKLTPNPTIMNTQKHTPTPWKTWFCEDNKRLKTGHWAFCPAIQADDGVLRIVPFAGIRGDVAEANAAFIVRAVNSHEALIEACKVLLSIVHEQSACVDSKFNSGIKFARKAIALAEKSSD